MDRPWATLAVLHQARARARSCGVTGVCDGALEHARERAMQHAKQCRNQIMIAHSSASASSADRRRALLVLRDVSLAPLTFPSRIQAAITVGAAVDSALPSVNTSSTAGCGPGELGAHSAALQPVSLLVPPACYGVYIGEFVRFFRPGMAHRRLEASVPRIGLVDSDPEPNGAARPPGKPLDAACHCGLPARQTGGDRRYW